jgi:tetratricopeptide (TPR) repeat protein
MLYLGLHQLLDSYANMPAFMLAAALPIAFLDSSITSRDFATSRSFASLRWPETLRGSPARLGACLVLIATIGLLIQEIPAMDQDRAVGAANDGNWADARSPALRAAASDPEIGSYLLMAGLVSDRATDHAVAETFFLRVASSTDLPEAWLNAAAQQVELGKRQDALASVEASLRLGYQRPAVAMPAGDLALQLGNRSLARFAFANAIATIPSLAGDPWWHADPARAALFPSIIDAAIMVPATGSGDGRWEIPLMTGDGSRARAMLPSSDELSRLVVDAWEGDQAAQRELFSICATDPLNATALMWCARVAGRLGDALAAERYRETAGVIAVSLAKHGAELRVSPSGTRIGQLPGSIADLWATYTYRRPGPWDILVPSLVHLHIE